MRAGNVAAGIGKRVLQALDIRLRDVPLSLRAQGSGRNDEETKDQHEKSE
jgi:hypothetical protein